MLNVGGEGEVPGVINQQRPAALDPTWGSCVAGATLEQLALQGHNFLICPNTPLPINGDSVDRALTNSVPIDTVSLGQPGIQSSEIRRVLVSGGEWVHDGAVRYTKR